DLPAAVALNGVSMNVARAVGPAAGGLLFAARGPGAVFVANAVSFLAVIAALLFAEPAPRSSSLPPQRVVGALRAGMRFVRHSPPYGAVLVRSAGFMLPASALWALLPLVARNHLGMSAIGYGLLLGSLGSGAIVGAALLPTLRARLTADQLLAAATLVFAATTALLGLVPIAGAAAAPMFVPGIRWMGAMATLTVAAQSAAPAWVRARALATSLLVVQGGLALGSLAWGALADRISSPNALHVGAAALVLSTAVTRRFRLHGLADLDL